MFLLGFSTAFIGFIGGGVLALSTIKPKGANNPVGASAIIVEAIAKVMLAGALGSVSTTVIATCLTSGKLTTVIGGILGTLTGVPVMFSFFR